MIDLRYLTLAGVVTALAYAQYSNSGSGSGSGSGSQQNNLRVHGVLTNNYLEQSASGAFSGLMVDLLDELAKQAGFTYTLAVQPDGENGANTTGTWNGLIGALINKQCDIGVGGLTVSSDRDDVVDFVTPFNVVQTGLIVKRGTSLNGIRYLIRRGSSKRALFEDTNSARLKAIWADIQANNGFVETNDEGLQKALTGNFAFVGDSGQLKAFGSAELEFTSAMIATQFEAMAVQQGSPLRDRLSIATSKINEKGILQDLLAKWKLA